MGKGLPVVQTSAVLLSCALRPWTNSCVTMLRRSGVTVIVLFMTDTRSGRPTSELDRHSFTSKGRMGDVCARKGG